MGGVPCTRRLVPTLRTWTTVADPLLGKSPGKAGASSWSRGTGASGSSASAWDFTDQIRSCKTLEEHFDFFKSQKDCVSPADLCLLLEGVWAAARRQHGPSRRSQARKELFNTVDFMQIMKDVVWKVERFGPKDIPRLICALHEMQWHDRQLFRLAQPLVARAVPQMERGAIPRLVTSYVSAGCGGDALFDILHHTVVQASGVISPAGLAELVGAFSKGPYKQKAFLEAMVPEVIEALPRFTGPQFVEVLQAYTCWPMAVSVEFLAAIAATMLNAEAHLIKQRLTPHELVEALRALAFCSNRTKVSRESRSRKSRNALAGAFRVASERLLLEQCEFRAEEAAGLLWALWREDALARGLFIPLCECIASEAKDLSGSALASSILIVGRAAGGKLNFMDLAQQDPQEVSGEKEAPVDDHATAAETTTHTVVTSSDQFLTAAEGPVRGLAAEFSARELRHVILGYALASTGSVELFAVLQKACMHKIRESTADATASLLWSFATVRLGPTLFKEAQFDILEGLHQLSVPAICDVLWSYCVARHRDPKFFKALLGMLVPSRVAGDPRCGLLCPALLDIRANFPDMDPEGLDRYLNYAKSEFRRAQRPPPADVLQSLSRACASLSLEHELIVDVDGYLVDAVASPGGGAADTPPGPPIAVLHHGHRRTLHCRTSAPLGQEVMRQRHLRGRGFRIVNLWEQTWDPMGAEEQAALLRSKLPPAGGHTSAA